MPCSPNVCVTRMMETISFADYAVKRVCKIRRRRLRCRYCRILLFGVFIKCVFGADIAVALPQRKHALSVTSPRLCTTAVLALLRGGQAGIMGLVMVVLTDIQAIGFCGGKAALLVWFAFCFVVNPIPTLLPHSHLLQSCVSLWPNA